MKMRTIPEGKYVVGTWERRPINNGLEQEADASFTPCSVQPSHPISDLEEMVAWAKNKLPDYGGGTYSFVYDVAGTIVLEQQLTFFDKLGMEAN